MVWIAVIVLGIIQGITEFLPVSSSGHLLIASNLLGLGNNFELYVLLNLGTLGALIWYTRQILAQILRRALKGDFNLLLKIIASIVPTALLGFFLLDFLQKLDTNLILTASMLAAVGVLMLIKPLSKIKFKDIADISWPVVALISLAQAAALVPGVSRLGATLLCGLFLGLKKDVAITWSFLIGMPLILGAIVRVLLTAEGGAYITNNFAEVVVANIITFAVGITMITFLVKILEKYSLRPFGFYRLGIASLIAVLLAINVL